MTDLDTVAAEAILGDEADKFLRSELGKTILGIAKQEAEFAMEALKQIEPTQAAMIRELQNKIWRADCFEQWLRDLVTAGEQALKVIEHDEASQ